MVDTVYLKYGINVNNLMTMVDQYQLLQDEDVKSVEA